jgi:hypothetical protein
MKIGIDLKIVAVLTLIFLTLKLAGLGVVADWSWWWVFSPIWITALSIIAMCCILIYTSGWKLVKK